MMEQHVGKSSEEVTLKCTSCGTILKGDVLVCGVCDATAERFLPIDKEEFEPETKEQENVTTFNTFDSVEVTWTQEALDALNDYPEGHVRRRAHARIEKNARIQKINAVSLSFVNKILNERAVKDNGNGKISDGKGLTKDSLIELGSSLNAEDFNWSKDAMGRLEKVPKGFMRDNTQGRVMAYAKSNNITDISLEVCEEGIRQSIKIMEEAMATGASLEDFLPKKVEA
jgi:hypothetical protein